MKIWISFSANEGNWFDNEMVMVWCARQKSGCKIVGKGKILLLSFGVVWTNDYICIGILKRKSKSWKWFKKNQTYIQILKA